MDKIFDLSDIQQIRDVAPELADMLVQVCISHIEDMYSSLQLPDGLKQVQELDTEKKEEMIDFYSNLVGYFSEIENYELCAKILDITEKLGIVE